MYSRSLSKGRARLQERLSSEEVSLGLIRGWIGDEGAWSLMGSLCLSCGEVRVYAVLHMDHSPNRLLFQNETPFMIKNRDFEVD